MPDHHFRCHLYVQESRLLLYKLHCRFQGAETPNKLAAAFQALGDLLHCLGLSTSLKKDSPPATLMVFLGVLVNATEMTISITTDCLPELHSPLCISALCDVCFTTRPAALAWHHVFCHPLCTSPAHVFMLSLLYTLRSYRLSKYCPISSVNHSDICW